MDKAHALQLLFDVMSYQGAANGTTLERALTRAEARAGISHLSLIDEAQMNLLLTELAAEGGRIQEAAETIAAWRTEAPGADAA